MKKLMRWTYGLMTPWSIYLMVEYWGAGKMFMFCVSIVTVVTGIFLIALTFWDGRRTPPSESTPTTAADEP